MYWALFALWLLIGGAIFTGIIHEERPPTLQSWVTLLVLSFTWPISVPLTMIIMAVKHKGFRPK